MGGLLQEKYKILGGKKKGDSVAIELELKKLAKERKRLEKQLTPAQQKRLKEESTKTVTKELANARHQHRKSMSETGEYVVGNKQEDADRVNEITGSNDDPDAIADKVHYYENQLEQTELEFKETASKLEKIKEDMSSGQLTKDEAEAKATEVIQEAVQKQAKSKTTNTKPEGTKKNPKIIQYKDKQYDLHNDISYNKISETETALVIDGVNVGTVRKGADDTYTVVARIDGRLTTMQANDANDTYKVMAMMFHKQLSKLLEKKGVVDSPVDAEVPTEKAWSDTQRYQDNKPVQKNDDVDNNPVAQGEDGNVTEIDENFNRVPSEFDLPEDKVLAIQISDQTHKDFGKLRVFWQGDKQTVGEVVGKLKENQFHFVTVNKFQSNGKITKNSTIESRTSARPLNPEDYFINVSGKVIQGKQAGASKVIKNPVEIKLQESPRSRQRRPINIEELESYALPAEEFDPDFKSKRIANNNIRTYGDLHRYLMSLETQRWNTFRSIKDMEAFVSHLAAGYRTLDKKFPNGVKLTNASRKASYDSLKHILTKRDPENVNEILSIFNRVAGTENRIHADPQRNMPKFEQAYGLNHYKTQDARNLRGRVGNTISLNPEDSNLTPHAITFAHELGHWAYFNMLDNSDKIEFWNICKEYMGNSGLNVEAMKQKLPGFFSNEITSPQEFFANQFSLYILKQRDGKTASLFKRVTEKLKNLIAVVIKRDNRAVDPRMEDLFERIMPDPGAAKGGVTDGRPMKNQFAKLYASARQLAGKGDIAGVESVAAQQLYELREMQIELEELLTQHAEGTTNPRDMQEKIYDVAKSIYTKFGGKPGTFTHGNGAKRVLLLDSYKRRKTKTGLGNTYEPFYAKKTIVGADGKERKPFYFHKARVARSNLLRASMKIHQMMKDQIAFDKTFKNKADQLEEQAYLQKLNKNIEENLIEGAGFKTRPANEEAELLELIDQQRLDDESYEKGVEEAFNDQMSSDFQRQAEIKGGEAVEEKTMLLMENVANDLVVALDMGIEEFVRIFNTQMNKVDTIKAPNINKAGVLYSAGNTIAKKITKRQKSRAHKLADIVNQSLNESEDFINSNVQTDEVVSKSPKDMSDGELLQNIVKTGGFEANSPDAKPFKVEIHNRRKAVPFIEVAKDKQKARMEFFREFTLDMSKQEPAEQLSYLRKRLDDLVNAGDYDKANDVIAYSMRLSQTPNKVKSSVVGRALEVESHQTRMHSNENGIPGDAPITIKEVLSKITHRDKVVEHGARTMLYRMLNLLGKTALDNIEENTAFMSMKDLYAISGTKPLQGSKAGYADMAPTKGVAFNDMRKQLRRHAIGINKGDADPFDVMHEIGHMMSRTIHTQEDRDIILDSFTDAINRGDPAAQKIKSLYQQFPDYRTEDIAEEWFVESWAQWLGERVAKGNIFDVRYGQGQLQELKNKPYLMQLADNLYEYVAYVVNGLIGRKSVKQMFRQMTYHGDMFTPNRNKFRIKNLVDEFEYPAVSMSTANTYARQVIDSMPLDRQLKVREFLGIGQDEDLMDYVMYHGTPALDVFNKSKNPDVYIKPSINGMMGPGVYVTPRADFAGDFADPMERSGLPARDNIIATLTDPQARKEAEALSDTITRYEEQIMDMEFEHFGMSSILDEVTEGLHGRELELMHQSKDAAQKAFSIVTGYKQHSGVMPLFVRKQDVLDLSQDKLYTMGTNGSNDALFLINKLQGNGHLSMESRERLVNKLSMDDEFDGELLYAYMIEAVDPNNHEKAKTTIAKFLQDEGYAGIKGGQEGSDEQLVIFSPNLVKHIDADSYDSDRKGIFHSVIGSENSEGVAGSAMEHMMRTGKPLDVDDMVYINKSLVEAGSPEMAPIMKKMLQKKPITAEDKNKMSKFSSVMSHFKENSQQLRMRGVNWLADIIKPATGVGIYERHDIDLADKIYPIFEQLKEMPDNANWFKRWSRKNSYLIPKIGKLGELREEAAQPGSHKRILQALRRGRDAVEELSDQEKRTAMLIARTFENERQTMVKAGIPIGDARRTAQDFYIPQQWNTEKFTANPGQAVEMFTRFFKEERLRPDYETTPGMKSPRQTAEDLVNAIISASGETYGDDVIRRAVGDPSYQRLIKIDPEQYDYLEDFLVNDLEGLLTQYFDRTTRKIALTEKLGLGGHGYHGYLTAAQRGTEGVADTIKHPHVRRYLNQQYQSQIDVERQIVPKAKAGDGEINIAMDRINNLLADEKYVREHKNTIKNILYNLYDPEDHYDPQLKIRIDAIANGLVDFPNRGLRDGYALKITENMIDILNKRPLVPYAKHELAYKISRGVKTFNAISLLGFTTLTSGGDFVLPLIRSGNFKAYTKALANYFRDPEYRKAARAIGTGVENLMHDRMVQMAGEGSQKLQNSFFNFTLLTPWTNINREIAGMVGYEAFKSEIARARKMIENGQQNTKSYATAIRFLQRYGMTGENADVDFMLDGAPRLNDIRLDDEKSNKALRYAIMKFANETVYTPNPNDIPAMVQTPWGSMLFQLKSFQLMMARMGKYIVDEFNLGNPYPAMYMLTAGIGAGMFVNNTKDFIQSRGGEDEESAAPRKRTLQDGMGISKLFADFVGVDEGSMTDKVMANYFEGMLAIGGFGLFGELLYNTAAQADNGAYGKLRTFSAFLGPGVGMAEDMYDVAIAGPMGIFDPENKNARRREAVRSVVGRIPVAGGIRGFRESAVDTIAGEPGKGGKKSTSGGGFDKGGFNSKTLFDEGGFD